jgi:hypothetical protein
MSNERIRVTKTRKNDKELSRVLEITAAVYGRDIYLIEQHGASVLVNALRSGAIDHKPEALIFPHKRQVVIFDETSYDSGMGRSLVESLSDGQKRPYSLEKCC